MSERTRDPAIGPRRLGFGVSGPHGTALVRPEATIRLVQHAFAMGVRVFDTGPSYGDGEAERRLGEALARLPSYEPIVSTKAGVLASGLTRRVRDFSADGLRRSIEGSLRRLRRSRVDWLFLHGPSPRDLTDDVMRLLLDLRSKGDVGALGVAGRGEELEAAAATGHFSLFMTPVHAGLPQGDRERLGRLRAAGELIGIETLAPVSRRFPAPTSAGATWRLARALLGRAGPASSVPMSVEEALNWALTEGGAHRIITTTTRLDHLEKNVRALAGPASGRLITA